MFGFITSILGVIGPPVVNALTCGSVKKIKAHTDEFVDKGCSDRRVAAQSLRSVIYSIVIITSIIWVLIFVIVMKEDAWNRIMDLVHYFLDQPITDTPLCK